MTVDSDFVLKLKLKRKRRIVLERRLSSTTPFWHVTSPLASLVTLPSTPGTCRAVPWVPQFKVVVPSRARAMATTASLARAAPARVAMRGTRVSSKSTASKSTSGSRNRAANVVTRAGWAEFAASVKREVDITFNPRTNGAKIAGRCPDTQEIPTEVGRAEETRLLEDGVDGFDLLSFTKQLEQQLNAQNAASTAVERAETQIHAELAARLAEVTDGYEVFNAGAVAFDAMATAKASDGGASTGQRIGTAAKTERQQVLERAYYGKDYEGEGPLSGRELALLCYGKYGVYHDMAVKHVKMGGGMQRWVSLNLYVGHLGQRSYPSTETQYVEQMDAIAYMVTQWGQADFTRAFFREKPVARRGLPSRPRVDTCVTLQLSQSPTWDDELGDEYFTY